MAAQHKPKLTDTVGLSPLSDRHPPRSPASVRAASVHDRPVASPAQALAARLESQLNETDLPKRWPLAISAPLCFAASGLLWYGIIEGVLAILRK